MRPPLLRLLGFTIPLTFLLISCGSPPDPSVHLQPCPTKSTNTQALPTLTVTYLSYDAPRGGGDGVLLTSDKKRPGGAPWNMLIDPYYPSEGALVGTLLQNHKVSHLNLLVLTHPHDDHFGGAFELLDAGIRIDQVWINGDHPYRKEAAVLYPELLNRFEAEGIPVAVVNRGLHLSVFYDRGCIEILHPTHPLSPWPTYTLNSQETNGNSLVMRLHYGQVRFLFTGDLTWYGERELIAAFGDKGLDADIVEWAHHGNRDTGTLEFFEAVTPDLILYRNPKIVTPLSYHTSTVSTLGERKGASVGIRGTGTGELTISTDGLTYSVSDQHPEPCPTKPLKDNLLANGSLEAGIQQGWKIHIDGTLQGSVTPSTTATDGDMGLRQEIFSGNGEGRIWYFTDPLIKVDPEETYDFQACVWVEKAEGIEAVLRMTWRDSEGVVTPQSEILARAGETDGFMLLQQRGLVPHPNAEAVRVDLILSYLGQGEAVGVAYWDDVRITQR